MAKSKSSSFVITRRLYPTKAQEDYLDNLMFVCNRIYNTAVRHYKKVIEELYNDKYYIYCYEKLKEANKSKNEKLAKTWLNEISVCMIGYKLTEYDIHEFMGNNKVNSYSKLNQRDLGIGINIVQKLGNNLYQSIKKAVFAQTEIHFRKRGQTCSFEDKKATSGIIYKDDGTVNVLGVKINIKPVRYNDKYMQEALMHKIKYCRIIREPFKNKYKYFLQLILEGTSPIKHELGDGDCGIDEGISTIAYYNDKESDFEVLGNGIEKYEKGIHKAAIKYERRLRLNNPDCYDENGVIIKGSKFKRTKGSRKALMELKNAYRKKTKFIKESHNKLANKIISNCNIIIKEPMDYKNFKKRAKELKRQNKTTTIKNKSDETKQINKYKKRKRFGKSINRRSPGLFNKILENKIKALGGEFINVNINKYKASKYNHVTRNIINCKLSDRVKIIDNNLVQRDLYSSFLLYNYLDLETIDFDKCDILFEDFLTKQEKVIEKITFSGDNTKNFGLKDFM